MYQYQYHDDDDDDEEEEDADRAGDLNWGQSVSFQQVRETWELVTGEVRQTGSNKPGVV